MIDYSEKHNYVLIDNYDPYEFILNRNSYYFALEINIVFFKYNDM